MLSIFMFSLRGKYNFHIHISPLSANAICMDIAMPGMRKIGKWMAEWGSLACEIILAGNLLFRFIMKFFYSEQWGSNSRYIRCFLWRASLARLSVRLILGLADSRGSSKFCSRFETEASPWFWRWTCALNAYKSFQRQKSFIMCIFSPEMLQSQI